MYFMKLLKERIDIGGKLSLGLFVFILVAVLVIEFVKHVQLGFCKILVVNCVPFIFEEMGHQQCHVLCVCVGLLTEGNHVVN